MDSAAIGKAALVGGVIGLTGGIAGAATKGAITVTKGALSASTTGGRVAQGVAIGSVGNASSELAAQVINGENIDAGAIAEAGAIGAVAGIAGGVAGAKAGDGLKAMGFRRATPADLVPNNAGISGGIRNPKVAEAGANVVQAAVGSAVKVAEDRYSSD